MIPKRVIAANHDMCGRELSYNILIELEWIYQRTFATRFRRVHHTGVLQNPRVREEGRVLALCWRVFVIEHPFKWKLLRQAEPGSSKALSFDRSFTQLRQYRRR
jgi:hypothetical protein